MGRRLECTIFSHEIKRLRIDHDNCKNEKMKPVIQTDISLIEKALEELKKQG